MRKLLLDSKLRQVEALKNNICQLTWYNPNRYDVNDIVMSFRVFN